jgi:hypothetical protein
MVSTCAYLYGGVLLRGQVDSSKDFAEGTWGIVTCLHQECNEYRKTTSTTNRWQNAQMLASSKTFTLTNFSSNAPSALQHGARGNHRNR